MQQTELGRLRFQSVEVGIILKLQFYIAQVTTITGIAQKNKKHASSFVVKFFFAQIFL